MEGGGLPRCLRVHVLLKQLNVQTSQKRGGKRRQRHAAAGLLSPASGTGDRGPPLTVASRAGEEMLLHSTLNGSIHEKSTDPACLHTDSHGLTRPAGQPGPCLHSGQ